MRASVSLDSALPYIDSGNYNRLFDKTAVAQRQRCGQYLHS